MVEQRRQRDWRDYDDDRFPGEKRYGRVDPRGRHPGASTRPEERRRDGSPSSYDEHYGGRAYGYGAGGRGTEDFEEQPFSEGDPQRDERSLWDRGVDEVSSWLGDERARERRANDQFRGKGPRNYTRSDERIREDVCDRLTESSTVDASDIDVQVGQGEVTLTGTVPTREQRRAAEDCAERVMGVMHVQNNVRVAQGRPPIGNAEQSSRAERPDTVGGAEFGQAPDSASREST